MTEVTWKNRIVGYDPAVALDQLLAHPMNPKIHPQSQTEAVKGVLREVGWIDGLKVNVCTQHVLDGHDRIKAAMQAGQATAPVFYIDVDEAEEPYILGTFDPVGALAATDRTVLDALLQDVRSSESAVQALLAETANRAGLYRDLPNPPPALTYPTAPPTAYQAPPLPGAPTFSPNITPSMVPSHVTGDSIDQAQQHLTDRFTAQPALVSVTCPHCGGGLFIQKADAA